MVRASSHLRLFAAILASLTLALGAFGAWRRWNADQTNILFFVAWCAAMLALFALALRLPLRVAGPRYRAALWNVLFAGSAVILAFAANIAVFRHDVHFDVSREASNTPPQQLEAVVKGLQTDIALTYLYNSADEHALKATDLLTIASRQNRHFHFHAVDLDKDPAAARRLGVRAYNTAVIESEDRRAVVENTVDLAQIAYAALRVLKKRIDTLCFITGHGEGFSPTPAHVHYSHVETLKGHDTPGAGDVLAGAPDGLDRLQLAVTTLGYAVRAVVSATSTALPSDCAVVADIGPRSAYAQGEAAQLADYLGRGGHVLLALDPNFPITQELSALLDRLGLAVAPSVIIDPLNHYGADDDKVAVPYYPPHPITRNVALTVFPDARPIEVAPAAGTIARVLAASSEDSYLRPVAPGGGADASRRGQAILAVAVEGRWPDASAKPGATFRLVLVGNSNFASNAFFPSVSNGDLAVGMFRWLAGDEGMPAVKPQTLALQEIDLTARQMRGIFVVVELLLPLSVILLGGIVWWRRR